MKRKYRPEELPPAFCILPWTQVATSVRGFVRLCCHTPPLRNSGGQRVVLDAHHSVTEVWNSEPMREARRQMLAGQLPTLCGRCASVEAKGLKSKRLHYNGLQPDWAGDFLELIAATSKDGALARPPIDFDLRFGNVCNLKCVMCRPDTSSKWTKDFELLQENGLLPESAERFLRYPGTSEGSYDWYQQSDVVDFIANNQTALRHLYFAGGEPLLIPQHKKILQQCIDAGVASQVHLAYDSNGTQITEEWLRIWEHFASVDLHISVDGVGSAFEYIRYPAKWDDFNQRMKLLANWKWPQASVRLLVTLQILNAFEFPKILDWVWSLNLPNLPTNRYQIIWVLVEWPECLSLSVLPKSTIREISQEIERYGASLNLQTCPPNQPFSVRDLKERLLFAANLKASPPPLTDFFDYVTALDRIRGTNWQQSIPRLAEVLGTDRPAGDRDLPITP